jgi:hypothetical protein
MECRLVLNNHSESDISNNSLSGQLHQQLKYYKFHRVSWKIGKPVFCLFFRKEKDTYYALQVAKSIKNISLVRYYHRDVIAVPLHRPDDISPSEMQSCPVPPKNIDRFATKV